MDLRRRLGALLLVGLLGMGAVACTAADDGDGADTGGTEEPADDATEETGS